MRMHTKAFDRMLELVDYVNVNGIPQERIVNIFESQAKNFILIYYAK